MTNMIQNAKDQAAALAMAAYKAAAADGTLPEAEVKTAPVEIPKDTANGDYTTTFALAAAKALGKPPRVIAQALYLCGDRWPRLPELPTGRPVVCRRHERRGNGEGRLRHQ